jgi:hypothetical protein
MEVMRTSIAVAVASVLTASNIVHAQDDPLVAVTWLAGCWAAEGRESGSVEHWLAPAGATMLGMSRTVRSGRTVQFEFMQFRVNGNGKLEFVALPSGQKETSFALVSSSDGLASFEAPAHDFPQKVTYQALPGGRMVGRIEGIVSGRSRVIEFPHRRIPCEEDSVQSPK